MYARAAAEAIGRLFDPERIERPNVAHVARDGRGIERNAGSRGISRDAGEPGSGNEEAAGG